VISPSSRVIGGTDVCLTSVLDDHIAAVASLGATTIRAWAKEVAQRVLLCDSSQSIQKLVKDFKGDIIESCV